MSDVDELKRKLRQGWAALDPASADSAPGSASTLVSADSDDVSKLSSQLNAQMSYNTDLISQMRELETENMNAQRKQQEHHASLKHAKSIADALRVDLVEAKRAAERAKAVAARCADEANRAKVDAGIKAREADGLLKFAEEAKDEIQALRAELAATTHDAKASQRRLADLRDESARREDEERAVSAENRLGLDELGRELARVRASVGPLEAELAAARARSGDLDDAVRSKNVELKAQAEEMVVLKSKLEAANEIAQRVQQDEDRLLSELSAKDRALQRTEEQVAAARELSIATDNQLGEERDERAKLVRTLKEQESEIRELKSQLDTVMSDLENQMEARQADRDRGDDKARELTADLATIAEDARVRERALAEENSKREAEVLRQRKEWESRSEALQDENRRLNELLRTSKEQHDARLADFETERDAYATKIAESIERARALEEKAHEADGAVSSEVAALRERLVAAQADLGKRTQIHVDALGALENTVAKQAQECLALKIAHDGLSDELQVVRRLLREQSNRAGPALEEWYAESKQSMIELATRTKDAQNAADAARVAQGAAEGDPERGPS